MAMIPPCFWLRQLADTGRTWGAAALILLTAGCISPVDYGKIRHSDYVADARCSPSAPVIVSETAPDKSDQDESNQDGPNQDRPNQSTNDRRYFVVTSRLPDCRNPGITLLNHRSDKVRYGRFAAPDTVPDESISQRVPLTISNETQWWKNLSSVMDNREGRVLLYVHGYRETFYTASRDTVQIARLTGFTGPVIQYSWPSQGEILKYAVDETNMYWDERNFRRFLTKLARQGWTKEIILVSHSLGARLVIPAVEYVDTNSPDRSASVISNIILASPDVDTQDFERDIAEEILSQRRVDKGRRVTIYTSAKDRALALSYDLHGYPRLGSPDCFDPFEKADLKARGLPERCYAVKAGDAAAPEKGGLTIIDTSAVREGRSRHSDYLRSAAACLDFAAVVNGEQDRKQGRDPTYLPHVFTLPAPPKDEKPDHDYICRRTAN